MEAGALCHLDTGLTLAVHTGDGAAALDILSTLKDRGVSPEAYVWVHAQNEKDRAIHEQAARARGLGGVRRGGLGARTRRTSTRSSTWPSAVSWAAS